MRRDGKLWMHLMIFGLSLTATAQAQERIATQRQPAPVLARDQAVRHALQHNPYLMTVRKQLGLGEAAIVVSKTYPFNPIFTGYVTGLNGPPSAGITNYVQLEDYISLELEIRGQGKHRRAAANAQATRIEWEVSAQELGVTMAVTRAFNAVVYRQHKLALLREGIKINELQVEELQKLVDAGKAKSTDLTLASADLAAAHAQQWQAKTALSVARSELRKQLGTLDDNFEVSDELEVPLAGTDPQGLRSLALEQRPDLRARRAAIEEAEANHRLVVANRCGNPSVGPFFEYDPGSIYYVGARISFPIAIFNTKKGEILQAQTVISQAKSQVYQLEIQAAQEVLAALERYADAKNWADSYGMDVLPNLGMAKISMEKLFNDKNANADLPRLLAVSRAYLKASESYLDARYEQSLAQVDLAQATAEPRLAVGSGLPPGAAARK